MKLQLKQVLYLYENQIEFIQNLDFATLLQYLYLQNNVIREIPLLNMPNLRKIYLDENDIKIVTGFSACENLEELHVANQRLPSFSTLQFDPHSLHAMAHSLQVLEISGNGISNLSQFVGLQNLRRLICKDNAVVDMNEIECIVSLPHLEEANFKGNPCGSIAKYRDITIGASSEVFNILDEVPIPKHQQVAIKGLMAHRVKIGATSKYQHQHSSVSDHYQPHDLGSLEEGSMEFQHST
jgi:protein phosphatase 1 regulatory subunit 42